MGVFFYIIKTLDSNASNVWFPWSILRTAPYHLKSNTVVIFKWFQKARNNYLIDLKELAKTGAMVLNIFGGTGPHKFHTCIHRTLRSWKNEMCFFYSSYSKPPNPQTAETLGFNQTQVKNHCLSSTLLIHKLSVHTRCVWKKVRRWVNETIVKLKVDIILG